MDESEFLFDPAFLGVLSTKEQKYVTETIFTEPEDILKHMTTKRTSADGDQNALADTTSLAQHHLASVPRTPLPEARMKVRAIGWIERVRVIE